MLSNKWERVVPFPWGLIRPTRRCEHPRCVGCLRCTWEACHARREEPGYSLETASPGTSGTSVCLIANLSSPGTRSGTPQIAAPDALSSVQNGSIGSSGRRLDGLGLIEDGSDEILVGT